MDKAELGNKHICSSCGTKFYDLNKEIPTCPKCGTEIIIVVKPRLGRPPLNKNTVKVKKPEKDVQNPEKIEEEVKQVSEFEKDELFDPNNIAALIDKSKEESAETINKSNKIFVR